MQRVDWSETATTTKLVAERTTHDLERDQRATQFLFSTKARSEDRQNVTAGTANASRTDSAVTVDTLPWETQKTPEIWPRLPAASNARPQRSSIDGALPRAHEVTYAHRLQAQSVRNHRKGPSN